MSVRTSFWVVAWTAATMCKFTGVKNASPKSWNIVEGHHVYIYIYIYIYMCPYMCIYPLRRRVASRRRCRWESRAGHKPNATHVPRASLPARRCVCLHICVNIQVHRYTRTYGYTHAHWCYTSFLPSILFLHHSFLLAGGAGGGGGTCIVRRCSTKGIALARWHASIYTYTHMHTCITHHPLLRSWFGNFSSGVCKWKRKFPGEAVQ